MKIIWLLFIFEILLLTILKSFTIGLINIDVLMVLIHVALTSIILLCYKGKFKKIFIVAFFLRVIVMFWDIFARNIFVLPNSGRDSEMFFNNAILISENINLLGTVKGGIYTNISGLILYFIGPQRMVVQYINVLLGLSTIVVIYNILKRLDINDITKTRVILLVSIFPNSVLMSGLLLREAFPTFFVAISLYYLILWYEKSSTYKMVLSFLYLGIASTFHSGVIGIGIGYALIYLFYDKKNNTLKFTPKTIVTFLVLIGLFGLGFSMFSDSIFEKFNSINEVSDLYGISQNWATGEAAYLKNLIIDSPLKLILYTPIRSFYFLASPLPNYWRGVFDLITFLFDSFFYISVIYYYIVNAKKLNERNVLSLVIFIMIITSAMIFGIGVSNSGTAMRHRQKLIPLFMVLYGIIHNAKSNYLLKKMN